MKSPILSCLLGWCP